MHNGKHDKNILRINGVEVQFAQMIRDIKEIGTYIIVLLSIPNQDDAINNLYAVDKTGAIVWQSQDLKQIYPKERLLPYEQMTVEGNTIKATDFYGRKYCIDGNTGEILKCEIVK